jgi:hypothetical protein
MRAANTAIFVLLLEITILKELVNIISLSQSNTLNGLSQSNTLNGLSQSNTLNGFSQSNTLNGLSQSNTLNGLHYFHSKIENVVLQDEMHRFQQSVVYTLKISYDFMVQA